METEEDSSRSQQAGLDSTSDAILRLRNCPYWGLPSSLPFSTMTEPRRMVVTGHPLTSHPSQIL